MLSKSSDYGNVLARNGQQFMVFNVAYEKGEWQIVCKLLEAYELWF